MGIHVRPAAAGGGPGEADVLEALEQGGGAYLGLLYWRTRIWPATFTEDNRTSAEVSVNMVLQIFAAALRVQRTPRRSCTGRRRSCASTRAPRRR